MTCRPKNQRTPHLPQQPTGTHFQAISWPTIMKQVSHSFSCNRCGEKGTIALSVSAVSQLLGKSFAHFKNLLTTSLSLYLLKDVVLKIRSLCFIFVCALLLCTVFPAGQVGWSFTVVCGSTGDTGSGHACDFSDAGEAADSEDDSPQETPEDCVTSRMSVSDCQLSRLHAWVDEVPPSTLLVSQLLHPPTAHS